MSTRVTGAGLQAIDLHVALGGTPVLRGVSLSLAPGWTAIVGPNGAGKSTLLRALAGLLRPHNGQVRLDGRPLEAMPAAQRAQRLAWLPQDGPNGADALALGGELTVRETVALGRLPHLGLFGAPGPADDSRVDQAMAATGCAAWAHRRLPGLSGGERQRVALARALATQAPMLLLDEPTTHLDPTHQVALARMLRTLAVDHTVVSVLHDLPLALQAERVVVLRAGAVTGDGSPDDPALRAALVAAFDGAVRVVGVGAQAVVVPDWRG